MTKLTKQVELQSQLGFGDQTLKKNGFENQVDSGKKKKEEGSNQHYQQQGMTENGINTSNEVVISIWDQIQTQGNLTKDECENRLIIRRVPPLLRRNKFYNQFYDPKIVSIGPYHHGKPELQMAEKFKPRVAQLLFPNKDDVDFLYNKILEIVTELKNCYEQQQQLNDREFAQMMFLDCCLILALLEPCFPQSPFRNGQPMVISNFNLSFTSMSYESFFLLENQLPFRVLVLVTRRLLSIDDGEATKRIFQAVDAMPGLMLPKKVTESVVSVSESEEALPPPPTTIIHLFELHYRKIVPNPLPWYENRRLNIEDLVFNYRSVTDLKSRGIHFRRSKSGLLGDVNFTSYILCGKLEISPIFISSNFDIMISNTIAYEQSPYGPPMRPQLISFLTFLQSLIDSPDDVKELRSRRIINTLGMSDEQVANMFQKMNVGKDDPNMYYTVRKKINDHYNNWMKTSMAHLRKTYFNTPWAFIAFVAAATALSMAIVQAYFTIHPVQSNNNN
ncbi:UPF0481 protein At3g47200-like [Impatiens glandulifera]|uniref:UPF0481 protein At3g47200-like n=1 Tax=Impatiens glandulifera TaxID=253017 RepID=UPI001FB118EA|nr:UPF0481 protein At3g47200-like [Impatiens glandulifera]